jgi:hypothetical protein
MSSLIVPGVAFMIASSPETFKLMRKVAGNWVWWAFVLTGG